MSAAAAVALTSLPGGSYVDGYLSGDEADALLGQLLELFARKQSSQKHTYGITGFSGPQLLIFGHVGADPAALKLPACLRALVDRVFGGGELGRPPFQVTVNLYKDSKKELIPHKDGVGEQVIIVTLGEHTVLEFGQFPDDPAEKGTRIFPLMFNSNDDDAADETWQRSESSLWVPVRPADARLQKVWVRHGSLLRLAGPSFKEWAHGVKSADADVYHSADYINADAITHLAEGQSVNRGQRISIVLWSQ